MAHWLAVLPNPIMEVALSDWVEDFSATLARVLSFLGLPDDQAYATFHLQRRKVRTASAAQVQQPVNARGMGRWRRYAAELTPMTVELAAAGLVPQSKQMRCRTILT